MTWCGCCCGLACRRCFPPAAPRLVLFCGVGRGYLAWCVVRASRLPRLSSRRACGVFAYPPHDLPTCARFRAGPRHRVRSGGPSRPALGGSMAMADVPLPDDVDEEDLLLYMPDGSGPSAIVVDSPDDNQDGQDPDDLVRHVLGHAPWHRDAAQAGRNSTLAAQGLVCACSLQHGSLCMQQPAALLKRSMGTWRSAAGTVRCLDWVRRRCSDRRRSVEISNIDGTWLRWRPSSRRAGPACGVRWMPRDCRTTRARTATTMACSGTQVWASSLGHKSC